MILAWLFQQSFSALDLVTVAFLVVLEGVLSIDNALVLGILAKRLPKHQQKRALTYGLVGAFLFRFIAIAMAAWLMHWRWVMVIGGGYLIYICVKHFFFEDKDAETPVLSADNPDEPAALPDDDTPRLGFDRRFWGAVLVIELTDIAFAVDSILAAIGLVGARQEKFWVILTGGFLGVVLMRFAAVFFIKLLEKFPRFEMAAYLLVVLIGCKLVVDWWFNAPPPGWDIKNAYHGPLDFHSYHSPAFWVFWGLMVVFFCVGFIPERSKAELQQAAE